MNCLAMSSALLLAEDEFRFQKRGFWKFCLVPLTSDTDELVILEQEVLNFCSMFSKMGLFCYTDFALEVFRSVYVPI